MKKIFSALGLLIICSCTLKSPAQASYVFKQAFKTEAKVATKVTAKRTIKVVTEKVLREIPKGLEALKVVKRADGGLEPLYKNLDSKVVKGAEKYNKALLVERRKAIAPYMQFPTTEQLGKVSEKTLNLGKKADAAVLRGNMLKTMSPNAAEVVKGFGGTAAHHIVEGTDVAAKKSRKIFQKFGIDINHPANGIFLPTDEKSVFKGCLHKTSHTDEYSKYVYNAISKCKSKNEVIAKLSELKHEIYSGKLNLQGPAQTINKNKLIFN